MNINPIKNTTNGVLPLQKDTAWETAIDVVNYPVCIRPLWFKPSDECSLSIPTIDGFAEAVGDTKTGRGTQFFGVVVDRDRTCDEQVIAVVTGTYGTLSTAEVYGDLRDDLVASGIDATPMNVYVSGNGGRAILSVKINGMSGQLDATDVGMYINLDTSVDGSKKHTIRLSVVDADGIEIVGLGEQSFTLGAKHTKTIGERHVAFQTVLLKLASEWNDNIVPMLMLMNDCVFDRSLAIDFFEGIMDNAEIPERHIKNALASYRPESQESLFGVLRGISAYLEGALSDKPERLEDFRWKINKKASKEIARIIQQFRKA